MLSVLKLVVDGMNALVLGIVVVDSPLELMDIDVELRKVCVTDDVGSGSVLVLNSVGRGPSTEGILGVKDVSMFPSSWIVTLTVNTEEFPPMLTSISGEFDLSVTLAESPLGTNVGSLMS